MNYGEAKMDPKEKKEMVQLVGEVIDQKVTPRLEKIENKLTDHDKRFDTHDKRFDAVDKRLEEIGTSVEYIREQIAQNSVDITEMKEDVSDSKYTEERIETRLNSVVHNQDDIYGKTRQLNRRVLRLESKKG